MGGKLIEIPYSQIAFLKMYSTRAAQQTAIDAVQIFGGRGITQSGMGRLIEHVSIFYLITPLCMKADFVIAM